MDPGTVLQPQQKWYSFGAKSGKQCSVFSTRNASNFQDVLKHTTWLLQDYLFPSDRRRGKKHAFLTPAVANRGAGLKLVVSSGWRPGVATRRHHRRVGTTIRHLAPPRVIPRAAGGVRPTPTPAPFWRRSTTAATTQSGQSSRSGATHQDHDRCRRENIRRTADCRGNGRPPARAASPRTPVGGRLRCEERSGTAAGQAHQPLHRDDAACPT